MSDVSSVQKSLSYMNVTPLTYFDNLKYSQNSFADYRRQNSSFRFSFETEDRHHFNFKNETSQEGNKINNLVKLHLESCYLPREVILFFFMKLTIIGLTDTYPLINRLYKKQMINDLTETFRALTNP